MYEVKTAQFTGPMEKLLELIEAKHLDITRVNLAEVTGDFIAYIESMGAASQPAFLSDFIVVASRLLVIKSKTLLPSLELSEEEEGQILDLEHRLRLYREFKAGGALLEQLWKKQETFQVRPLLRSLGGQTFFYPSRQVTPAGLVSSMERLMGVMEGLFLENKTVQHTMISLQEKITELTKRLQGAAVTLKGRAKSAEKQEVIVLFLAVLHMLSNHLAAAEQTDAFGDIVVTPQASDNEQFALGNIV